jgi:hypothetical protein
VQSPYLADLIAPAVPPHREWVGFCLNVLVAAFNTNLVKRQELPASYQDLTDPRWKGRLGIEVDDFDWFAGLIEELGEANGLDTFRAIAATNGFSVRKGHTLLANLVAAGEVPLALTVFNYTAEQLKRKGAPVDWLALPPVISMPNSIAVASAAPPHAALLLLDFMLSDAQKLLAERDYVVTSTQVGSPLDRRRLGPIRQIWRTATCGEPLTSSSDPMSSPVPSAGTMLISHTARSPLARSPSALISQITADGSKDFSRLALDMSPKPPTPHVVDEGGNDLGNFPTTIELALQPGEVAHRFLGGAKSTDAGKGV